MSHISADSRNITCCTNAPSPDVELLSSIEYVGPVNCVVDDPVVKALVVVVSILVSLSRVILMCAPICKFFTWSFTLFVVLWHCILIDTCPL